MVIYNYVLLYYRIEFLVDILIRILAGNVVARDGIRKKTLRGQDLNL